MAKDNPTIGLYGIGGVYNYGCEAIVRGTEIILRGMYPNAIIKYASVRPEDDKQRLKGSNVEVIPRKLKSRKYIPELNQKIAIKTNFYSKRLFIEDLKWVKECDMVFSIGGDLYTVPHNYKEPETYYYNPLIHFGESIKSRGKKYVLWGASIGPFEGYPKIKNTVFNHLEHIDLIIPREPKTTRYLQKEGIKDNVIEMPDPAFFVPSPEMKKEEKDKLCIGINLSPLSLMYSFESGQIDQITTEQAKLIENIIQTFDADVLLIPHVVCDFYENDDDLRYLKRVLDRISEEYKKNVTLIENDPGFIGIKTILNNCDIVIAARMHCAINAISLGVPTLFVSYSDKSYGMSEFIYGNTDWVYDLSKLEIDSFTQLIKEFLSKKEYLKSFIEKRINEITTQKVISSLKLEY